MGAGLNGINIITRREIEARIAGPMIKAFIEELGRDRAIRVVRKVIESLARKSGRELAQKIGGTSTADFAKGLEAWAAGDSYEMEVLELNDTRYFFNITRCRYADMYRELGITDLGVVLSCGRDFKLVEDFNPQMRLIRTKTIMEGHEHCDFRITLT
jgi:predicted ArsR family transcriptional regulator